MVPFFIFLNFSLTGQMNKNRKIKLHCKLPLLPYWHTFLLFLLILYYFHFWDSKYLKVKGNKRETLMQVSNPWATCHPIGSFTFWTSWERYTTDLLCSGLAMPSQRNTFIPSHYVVRTRFVFVSPFCHLVTLQYQNVYTFLYLSSL